MSSQRKSASSLGGEKIRRYSIWKFSFGAASVAIASLFLFAGSSNLVSAAQISVETLPVEKTTKESAKPVKKEKIQTEKAPASVQAEGHSSQKGAERTTDKAKNNGPEASQLGESKPTPSKQHKLVKPNCGEVYNFNEFTENEKKSILDQVGKANPGATVEFN